MKHRRLYIRLLFSLLLYGIAVLVLVLTFTQRLTSDAMEKTEAHDLYRESTLIASDYASDYIRSAITVTDLQKQMEIASSYISADIYIVDNQNRILLSSADASIGKKSSSEDPVYQELSGFSTSEFGNTYYQINDFYGLYDEDMVTVFAPITLNYKNRGYVLITKPVSGIVESADDFTNITFYTVSLVSLLFLVILIHVIRSLYRPLRQIGKAAESYARGDFSKKIPVEGDDEIARLADTLNYMADEMDKMEEDQKKFISNVSHDFRSPLTSIHGYVEAMLDGTIPVEMQDRYLKIILFEAERLNKLTQSLLELNKFGHHGIHLEISDFDINDMIRQTTLTFEGKCKDKGLSFQLILTGEELYVTADGEKINQVVHNLIDNAVKFSKRDTTIIIRTSIRNEKVFVSVKDSGIGIPADSIKKVFDRFYKTDQSRGKDQKGSGLGLAIVKEIINAHKENINVVSTEGVGSEFIFSLPLSHKEEQD